ncbi:hypothetical protein SUVZ_07G1950 [Saccharomyces uvarum]|uniref:Uncharacterized protein n=1 Tax=Saccharomyces uvarum TaxID=230603 RepID=A0ABN8WT53_SACUV|nr:hypothetical protein SUVZ_07G1950 [Saccharomyces uvarum]
MPSVATFTSPDKRSVLGNNFGVDVAVLGSSDNSSVTGTRSFIIRGGFQLLIPFCGFLDYEENLLNNFIHIVISFNENGIPKLISKGYSYTLVNWMLSCSE